MNGSYSKHKWEYGVNARLGNGLIKLQGDVAYNLNSDSRLNASFNIGSNKFILKTGISYNFDMSTRIYMGIKSGLVFDQDDFYWLSGMNLSLDFHFFHLSLPITLGSYNLKNNTSSLLFSIGLMAVGILSFSYFAYRDMKNKK